MCLLVETQILFIHNGLQFLDPRFWIHHRDLTSYNDSLLLSIPILWATQTPSILPSPPQHRLSSFLSSNSLNGGVRMTFLSSHHRPLTCLNSLWSPLHLRGPWKLLRMPCRAVQALFAAGLIPHTCLPYWASSGPFILLCSGWLSSSYTCDEVELQSSVAEVIGCLLKNPLFFLPNKILETFWSQGRKWVVWRKAYRPVWANGL